MTSIDPIADLPQEVRQRLEIFISKVERIGLDSLPMYAARPLGSDHQRAIENAESLANVHRRSEAVATVREKSFAYLERRFADAQLRTSVGGLNWIGTGRVEDRARVAVSLGEAFTAIALWDLLDEDDRDEMLGPWAELAS